MRAVVIVPLVLVALVVALVAGQLLRPLPDPTMELTLASSHTFKGAAPSLPWPSKGQAEVDVEGIGPMGTAGGAVPTPTASVAKVMTAYTFLKEHPLPSGQAGPVFSISPQEAARLPARKVRGESHIDVKSGQRFTERKALEALMVVSANNLAHELARWDAGAEAAFVEKMNANARELGMTKTTYTDPSGYDSHTVSTAADQVKLLRAAMRIPAFAEVVANRSYVPNDGGPVRPASNHLLGQYGVVAGKTGYTDAAGGNFVFAARRRVAGVNTLIIGAVMGQDGPTAATAQEAAQQLIVAAQGALTGATLARKGQTVGHIDDGLGGRTPIAAGTPVTVVGWAGLTVRVGMEGSVPHQGSAGERVGTVTAGEGASKTQFPVQLPQALDEPSLMKRLTRAG